VAAAASEAGLQAVVPLKSTTFGNHVSRQVLLKPDRPAPSAESEVRCYDAILLNPAKHPVPKQTAARRFTQWLVSPEGQAAIGAYQVDGDQLFHPSATSAR
jgi:ABC-type tungstate transport system permease subunit